ncbi:MAG: DegV family protein [Clostridia bacterium]|nr:DegV family protein [Clostridia bacterium]
MAEFEIFVDSCANIPDEIRKKKNICVVPYIITINGEEINCIDDNRNYTETAKLFYQKMREGADVKSSLIGEGRFIDAFTPSLEAEKDIIVITLTAGLSGTYNQAVAAGKTLSEKYPDRKIYVFDSANASLGEGLLAIKIADMRDAGESVDACAEWLKNNIYKMNSYFTVDDLKYLRKSGRISRAVAFAGGLLNIKPLLDADAGDIAQMHLYGTVRGRKKALSAIVEAFDKNVIDPASQTIAIAHADCEEDALSLAATLKEHGAGDIIIEYYDICSGTHVGPGTIALFFMGGDRHDKYPKKTK